MSYYISTSVDTPFETAIETVTAGLAEEGFGVISDIDVRETMKQKLDVDFRNYRILGACNPSFAHRALESEDKIGALLPCNVVVQEHTDGSVEISAVDPVSSMQSVANPALEPIAGEIRERLRRVVARL